MSTTQPPKPKHRWYRFSLLTLLIVMTVATVAFGGWVQIRRQRAQENRERVAVVEDAVAAIEELGGEVTSTDEELRPQTWLEKQFDDPGGADDPVESGKIVRVAIPDSTNIDAVLAVLVQFPNLKTVHIFSGPEVALNSYEWTHESADKFLQRIRDALPEVEITIDVGAL